MKFKIIALIGIFILFAISYLYMVGPRHTDKHYIALDNFRTFTVEVTFHPSSTKNIMGFTEGQLSDLILQKLSLAVDKKFGANVILASRYGRPYSYRTNPLNLEIDFEVWGSTDKPPSFILGPTIKRSLFYGLTKEASQNSNRKYKEAINAAKNGEFPSYQFEVQALPKSEIVYVHSQEQLLRRVEYFTKQIVDEMDPQTEATAKVEKIFQSGIHN